MDSDPAGAGSSSPRTWPRAARHVLLAAVLIVANLWPAFYNGQPFFYPDTSTYIRGADAGVQRLTHRASDWSAAPAVMRPATASVSLSSIQDKTILAGRSVYYGALLYLGDVCGHLWPVLLIQSAVVLLALALTLRGLGEFTWLRLMTVSLLLAVLTPMPFFVSFLLPDIFAAVTIIALGNLLVSSDGQPLWIAGVWTALLSTALLFHVSHVLIALAMLALALPTLWLIQMRPPRRGVVGITCALCIALMGEWAFNAAVTKFVGEPPLRPPILMARMIADGPGYHYLRASCPTSGFTVCRFVTRLPLETDDFLWNTDPAVGVFVASDATTRRALAAEQYHFALAVFRSNPSGVVTHFLRDAGVQTASFGYQEFNYFPSERSFFGSHLPTRYVSAMLSTPAWQDRMPELGLSLITIATTCLALAGIAYFFLAEARRAGHDRKIALFAALLCLGTVVNAAVCALSATHDRYEARVVWLIPLAAMLLYMAPRQLRPLPIT